jgi:P pilus assembly chaperone PapD
MLLSRVAVFYCASVVFTGVQAYALGVTPLIVELSSSQTNRTAQILVENDSASDTPIEITVSRVEIDENGGQHLSPASSEFLVFPPARMLKPHAKQVFRFQWAGAPLAKSQTFIFAVNQLPVKMPESASGVQVIFNFDVIANVAPPSGTHTLDVVSSEIVTENDKRYPSLLVSNTGNVHAKLSDATLNLKAGAWSKTLSPGDLQLQIGAALVQPGKRRRFTIPVELPPQAAKLSTEITYEKAVR